MFRTLQSGTNLNRQPRIVGRRRAIIRAVVFPSLPTAAVIRNASSVSLLALFFWVGIHGCRNCIYDRKIYDSVVDLLMKLAQFWYFGHVSKSLVAKSTTAMNPNPGIQNTWSITSIQGKGQHWGSWDKKNLDRPCPKFPTAKLRSSKGTELTDLPRTASNFTERIKERERERRVRERRLGYYQRGGSGKGVETREACYMRQMTIEYDI